MFSEPHEKCENRENSSVKGVVAEEFVIWYEATLMPLARPGEKKRVEKARIV